MHITCSLLYQVGLLRDEWYIKNKSNPNHFFSDKKTSTNIHIGHLKVKLSPSNIIMGFILWRAKKILEAATYIKFESSKNKIRTYVLSKSQNVGEEAIAP